MDGCNHLGKKITLDDRTDGSSSPLREASTVKIMNDRSLLLSLNEITHYFKKWKTTSCVLKKVYCFYKNLMLQIDPLNSSCFQKQQYPEKTLRLKLLRNRSSLE